MYIFGKTKLIIIHTLIKHILVAIFAGDIISIYIDNTGSVLMQLMSYP